MAAGLRANLGGNELVDAVGLFGDLCHVNLVGCVLKSNRMNRAAGFVVTFGQFDSRHFVTVFTRTVSNSVELAIGK